MKKFLTLFLCTLLTACSSIIPYKDQNLDYLQGIEKDPDAYRGQVVSFGGEVKGITEDTLRLRLVLKIDAPLYYYATGKGNSLSYEMLLVTFNKRGMPAMTGIKKGHEIKVLARVSSYETRKNFTGKDIAVLHLIAFAIANRTKHQDFFRPETPDRQLYESWKEGKLFFEESAKDVIGRCSKQPPAALALPKVSVPAAEVTPTPAPEAEPEKGIIFDAEEPPFILAPDEPEKPAAENTPSEPKETASAENTAKEAPANQPATEKQENAALVQPAQPDPAEPTVCPEQEPQPSAAPEPETAAAETLSQEETPQPPAEPDALPAENKGLTPPAQDKTSLPEPPSPADNQSPQEPAATTAPAEASLSSVGEN